jgi:TolB-like protein
VTEHPTDSSGTSFWSELRRRKVVRLAIAYAVAGWMVVEVSLAIFPEFGIPGWANRMVILLVALGFPVALVLAWAFELTATGLQRTETARRTQGPAQEAQPLQRRRNRLAVLVGVLVPGVIFGALLGAAGLWVMLGREAPESVPGATQPVVAVLPLVNMSPDAENAFFADGVHEEILTELSRLGSIKVISRTSVVGYAGQDYSVRQIAAELKATHIVEGSVRRAGDRVRVTAQLIDAATDQHLWAQNFDRDLEDIFAVQSDVAIRIATSLGDTLQGRSAPAFGTRSIEAYDLYLQARSESADPFGSTDAQFRKTVGLLKAAVEIDPQFVQAWGLLSEVASRWSFQTPVPPPDALTDAREAATTVARLAPDSVDAFMARAWVSYYGDLAFAQALGEVRQARDLAPNLLGPMELEAYLLRRLGRFDESISLMREILTLDPRNTLLWQQLAQSMSEAGRDEEAYQAWLQVADIEPDTEMLNAVVEFWRLRAYPDFSETQALADRVLALARVGEMSREFFNIALFLRQTGRDDDADVVWSALVREFMPAGLAHVEQMPIELYHECRALEFRGEHAAAVDVATRALAAAEAFEAEIDQHAPGLREENDITVGYTASFVGQPQLARTPIRRIRTNYEENPDFLLRRDNNYFLMEVQMASDVEQARELFLETFGTPMSRLTLSELISTIHLWYPLLDDPGVRTLFADKPLHVKYLREIWPQDARPFPFDT